MRIYVAGHMGMVGSAIVRAIERDGNHSWVGATRDELDLTQRDSVINFLKSTAPDAVVIAAAKVGGIVANERYPVDFLSQNLQIQTNLIDGAHLADIQRLAFLGSSCIYPKFAPQPIEEKSLLTGALEPTNEQYAVAKIAGLKLVEAYRKQFKRPWISLMPTNLYGPGDNYDEWDSHVIPGIIRKICNAKTSGQDSVTLWGSGSPMREFLHVDDLAAATLFALQNYQGSTALNVGSGEEVTIRKLSEIVRGAVSYSGSIEWDRSKPDGTPRKLLDSSAIRNLGWEPSIDLETGLFGTIRELPFAC